MLRTIILCYEAAVEGDGLELVDGLFTVVIVAAQLKI